MMARGCSISVSPCPRKQRADPDGHGGGLARIHVSGTGQRPRRRPAERHFQPRRRAGLRRYGTGPFGTGSTAALVYRVVHSEPVPALARRNRPLIERRRPKVRTTGRQRARSSQKSVPPGLPRAHGRPRLSSRVPDRALSTQWRAEQRATLPPCTVRPDEWEFHVHLPWARRSQRRARRLASRQPAAAGHRARAPAMVPAVANSRRGHRCPRGERSRGFLRRQVRAREVRGALRPAQTTLAGQSRTP